MWGGRHGGGGRCPRVPPPGWGVYGGYCTTPAGPADAEAMAVGWPGGGAWEAAIPACTHPDRFASIVLVTVEVHPTG